MTKNITVLEELSKIKNKKENLPNINLVNFKKYQTEILEALEAGFKVKDVWRILIKQKKFNACYNTFARILRQNSNITK